MPRRHLNSNSRSPLDESSGGENSLPRRTGEAGTPGGTPPDRNTSFIETSRGFLSDAELAGLLGERVLACEEAIVRGTFAGRPLDEHLLLEFHRRISIDLVPAWAGRWRTVEVHVGNLWPPPAHRVPQLLRNYADDRLDWQPLHAIWQRRFKQLPPPATSP